MTSLLILAPNVGGNMLKWVKVHCEGTVPMNEKITEKNLSGPQLTSPAQIRTFPSTTIKKISSANHSSTTVPGLISQSNLCDTWLGYSILRPNISHCKGAAKNGRLKFYAWRIPPVNDHVSLRASAHPKFVSCVLRRQFVKSIPLGRRPHVKQRVP